VQAKDLSLPVLRGYNGPIAPSTILEPLLPNYLSGKGEGFWSDSTGKKFVVFSAKNKFNLSPAVVPSSPPRISPPPGEQSFSLEPAATSPVITHRFLDRKKAATIDVGRDKLPVTDAKNVLNQYTPSSFEGAMLLDSCRILATHSGGEQIPKSWGQLQPERRDLSGSSDLKLQYPSTIPTRLLPEGCWDGGAFGAISPFSKSKRLRVNPG
jgi:hypothetical protein